MVKPKRYTQVSYRNGRPIAAYVYLSGWPGHKSARTELVDGGLVVDYSETNEPLGLEIVNPESVSIETVDEVLRRIGEEPLKSTEVEALRQPEQIRSTISDQACQAIRTAMEGLEGVSVPGTLDALYGKAFLKAQELHKSMSQMLVMTRLLQGRHLTEHELEQIKRDLSASTARHVTLYLTSQRIISEDSRRLFENALESRNHFLHRFNFYDQETRASLEGDAQGLYELVNRFEIALRAFEEARAILEEKLGYDRKELEERIRSYVREEADRYD